MAWLYDAAMLVNRGSRYAIATGHVSHLNMGVTQQGFDLSNLLFIQLRLAATGSATGTSGRQPGLRPLPDQATLKFGQRCEHMKNQLARRAAGLDLFGQTFKSDATLLKIGHDLHKVGQAAPEPIQSPHHQGVPCPQRLAALLKLGARCILATGRFFVDHAAPSLLERVALQVKVLIISRYAGVSYALIHGRVQDIENLTPILTLICGFHEHKVRHFDLFRKPPFYEQRPGLDLA